ncbi:hypothetical protein DPMN_063768 [Dreissena polymorpha]|uniref:Uncharacterized protein n=1 Tax=Dreissena polymorpha TaxID=45954 RepID=A0A9D4HKG9_DREPO|nr:hypothetical protein DPMN_063768 [Dreissena polymorpha]
MDDLDDLSGLDALDDLDDLDELDELDELANLNYLTNVRDGDMAVCMAGVSSMMAGFSITSSSCSLHC